MKNACLYSDRDDNHMSVDDSIQSAFDFVEYPRRTVLDKAVMEEERASISDRMFFFDVRLSSEDNSIDDDDDDTDLDVAVTENVIGLFNQSIAVCI